MNYLTSNLYKNKYNNKYDIVRELGDGGNFLFAKSYFEYNNGPVLETKCPYNSTTSTTSTTLNKLDSLKPDIYVHQTIKYPTVLKERQSNGTVKVYNSTTKSSSNEMTSAQLNEVRNLIKEHVIDNGGLFVGINADSKYKNNKYNFYNLDNSTSTHAVTIIGWNDNYSKTNFKGKDSNGNSVTPTANGAYLIMNSWGKSGEKTD